MPVFIRQLSVADVDAYRALRLEALKAFPEAYGSTYDEAVARPKKSFKRAIANSAIFGAFVEEVLCGIACFVASQGAQDNHIGHLYQMYVRAEQQGRGLGQQLINSLIKHATTQVKQIYLGVGTQNRVALALYKKAGFEIYGTEPRALCIKGRFIDEHLMVKFLDQKENT